MTRQITASLLNVPVEFVYHIFADVFAVFFKSLSVVETQWLSGTVDKTPAGSLPTG